MDAVIEHSGSIDLLRTLTPEADAWVEENVNSSLGTWCNMVVIEPRYTEAIVEGMREAGLAVG